MLCWAGMLFLAVLLGGQEIWAKAYSVQIGAFQKYQNAQRQFRLLNKSMPSNLLDHLRIEKIGKNYVVKVGIFDDQEQALTLLSALKPLSPDAFIWQGDLSPENVLKIEKIQTKSTDQQSMKDKVSSSILPPPANQALLSGTIREISSLAPEQLGLPPGKNIVRLIIRVEETKGIKGFPDFLKEREGELLTVFSETSPPFFQLGNKITAVAEYRGNRFSRFYWINKPQAVRP